VVQKLRDREPLTTQPEDTSLGRHLYEVRGQTEQNTTQLTISAMIMASVQEGGGGGGGSFISHLVTVFGV